jgi:hypothetical protein
MSQVTLCTTSAPQGLARRALLAGLPVTVVAATGRPGRVSGRVRDRPPDWPARSVASARRPNVELRRSPRRIRETLFHRGPRCPAGPCHSQGRLSVTQGIRESPAVEKPNPFCCRRYPGNAAAQRCVTSVASSPPERQQGHGHGTGGRTDWHARYRLLSHFGARAVVPAPNWNWTERPYPVR